jgi:GT2 family glycosyltransferase/4-amino-4-deoxy-L-arabinose transferase-like glycosyltransferase
MVSIIIVNYQVKKELLSCIASIYSSKPKTVFEIVVVDNDETKTIEKELTEKFPQVRYIKNDNKGFGQANNVGASYAKGEFFFFLNPDTTVAQTTIDSLVSYLVTHKKTGIVAPMLYTTNGSIIPLQGARELTPLRAIFSFSLINKFFPKNSIAKYYWYLDEWDKKSIKEVKSIPGTAFVIRRTLYEKIQGFDENFFLYFEEHDLCKRVTGLKSGIVMHPKAKVFHTLGSSTKKSKKDISHIFKKSRFYYFKKHFGLLTALGTEAILRINKYTIFLILFIALGLYLRLFSVNTSMPFIGDQAWYYLSARDMLLSGKVPLVGIASSHPWLHQGALWTYLLAPVLWLCKFNPVSGAYLSATIGVVSIFAIYKLGSEMFSRNVGIISALLLTISPFVILLDRVPYHTSPIPFFTILLLYFLYKWIQGNSYYFPLLILMLAVLYNFEIAAFLFSILVFVIWLYGYTVKKKWARGIFKIKIIFLAFCGWFVVMLPMLLYDFSHGFPQTLKVAAWVGYRVLLFFGYPPLNSVPPVSFGDMTLYITESYQQMIFAANGFAAFVIIIASIFFLVSQLIKPSRKTAFVLLGAVNLFLILGLFLAKTPSGAYLPMVVPSVILLVALFFNYLLGNKVTAIKFIGIVGLISFIAGNSHYVFQKVSTDRLFLQRLEAAKDIVKDAEKKEYNLIGKGSASEFESFTMNYEYLTWWLGNGPSKKESELRFIISEENYSVQVKKEVIKEE